MKISIVHFEIPMPPPVNALYANVPGKGRVRTSRYRAWAKAAQAAVEAHETAWQPATKALMREMQEGYEAIIHIPERMRGDIDGRIKATLDLFVNMGVTPDDKFCKSVTAFRADTQRAGHVMVSLGPVRSLRRAEAA